MRDRVESHAHWFLEISHGIARFVMMKHVMHSGLDDIGHQFEGGIMHIIFRSEEHTSELQSLMRISYAVFCLKKKINTITHTRITNISTNTHTSTQNHI